MLNHTVRFAKSMLVFIGLASSLALSGTLHAQTFSNPAAIAIPASGNATPYPSNIAVSGLSGTIVGVTVTLTGIFHTFPDDIGALLVTPGGQRIRLFTDVGSSFDVSDVNLTFSATAANNLPDGAILSTGTFLPTQGGGVHPANFAAPAPAAPYSTDLTTINGVATAQNGTWSLFIDDDSGQDSGIIAGGWSVSITTTSSPVSVPGSPTGLAASAGISQATLTFAAPALDGGLPIAVYTATCNPGAFNVRGTASPLTVTGLSNGTTYTCSVTATNTFGTGAASGVVDVTPAAVLPGAPIIGTLSHGGNGLATIFFTPPTFDGGSTITGYSAFCNPGGFNAVGAISPLTVTSLTNGTAYNCKVTATNVAGTGPPSAGINVTPVAPGAPIGPFAYIPNEMSNDVSVIDTATNTVVATVAVGTTPGGIAVRPGGNRAYVTNFNSNTISVIDTASNIVVASVPVGTSPYGIAVNPAGTRAYVSNFNSNNVSVIDTANNTVVATVAVGTKPGGVAVNPAGTRIFVVNLISRNVSVIDATNNIVVATVAVGTNPAGVAVNPAGTRVYVANQVSQNVSVIDTTSNTVVATVLVSGQAFGVAVNPAGTRAYVTLFNNSYVAVIDTASNAAVALVPVGSGPEGIAVNPAGTRLYVANHGSNAVSVIDIASNSVVDSVAVGSNPVAFGIFIGGPSLASAPGAPTIGGVTPGIGQATIAFIAPASNGGSPITTYTATCNPGALSTSGPASPLTVTGLVSDGTSYTCAVAATNSAGTGAPSTGVTVSSAGSNVTFSAGSNGIVSPSGVVQVAPNGTVSFTVEPNAGFQTIVGGTCPIASGAPPFLAGPITRNCTVSVSFTPVAAVGFGAAASSEQARARHSATLLNDGRVLVAGGVNSSGDLKSAEIYDRVSNTWSAAGSMQIARNAHSATLLPDGRVLVVGGVNGSGSPAPLTSVEIYNPSSSTWSSAAALPAARGAHSAVLLPDGSLLVSGGGVSNLSRYNPSLNSWSDVVTAAVSGTAVLLNSGKVLVIDSASAMLFNPAGNGLINAGAMATARVEFAASVLANGRVLTAGGRIALNTSGAADIYSPVTDTWSAATPMSVPRTAPAVLLTNGQVLVVAGSNNVGLLNSAEVYDPGSNAWASVGSLATARVDHTVTRLNNGAVLIHGGRSLIDYFSSSELYLGVVASAPAVPVNVTSVSGIGQVILSFDPPPSNGGAAITSFTATCTAPGRVTRAVTGSGSPLTVTGLAGGGTYTCSLTATNGAGLTSGASGTVTVVLPANRGIEAVLMLLLD